MADRAKLRIEGSWELVGERSIGIVLAAYLYSRRHIWELAPKLAALAF